jgi:hypothetical protein
MPGGRIPGRFSAMWRKASLVLACAVWIATPALGSTSPPRPSANAPESAAHHQRVLASARAAMARATAQDRDAARRLIRQGDRAYRQKHYAKAASAYDNAYPNAPMAYAYVMAGDAHWRDVLQAQAAAQEGTPSTCPLDNHFFPRDLRQGLSQQQTLGLALADPALRTSWWYRRAHRSTACLQDLAAQAERQAPGSCADLAGLRACLGAPLPPP